MSGPRVVLDTNVVVSAFRSKRGASYRAVSAVGTGAFDIALSVPLVLEYEEALLAQHLARIRESDVAAALDYFCTVGHRQEIFFLWRPALRDPNDDMVLELAVAAECAAVVTYNVRDFRGADRFGVELWTPIELLKRTGTLP